MRLLEIVQTILTEVGGDEVNSISDTEEAEMVASHVKVVYNNLMSNSVWPHTRRALTVEARSDSNYPTHMLLSDDVKELIQINYNKAELGTTKRLYRPVTYINPDHFLVKLNKRDSDSPTIDVITDDSGIELLIQNNKHPDYYTSFDDTNLVFDSYDSSVDSSLQESKVQAMGYIIPVFLVEDTFEPDLPPDAFSLLIERSISRVQLKMRQFQDIESAQEAARQSRYLSRKNWRVDGGISYPNFGRKRVRTANTMKLQKDD